MAHKAYLTIDDSPSPDTDALVDFLSRHDITALLFCRGGLLEEHPAPVVRAIEHGLIIGNHNFSHRPAGDLGVAQTIAEIEQTETLIDAAYRQAGKSRPGRYFRFPYIDRGNGDRLERRFGEITAAPDKALPADENVQALQDYLQREGFTQPFAGVTHPLYQNADIAAAADCLFTYSACDWMLTERHHGQWNYRTIGDLTRKIDDDPHLCRETGPQIALFHDQGGLLQVVVALIRHMTDKGFSFLPFTGNSAEE